MDWGEWVPKLKDNVLLAITSVGVASIVGILFFFGLLPGLWALVLTVVEVALHLVWYAWGKMKDKETNYFETRLDKVSYIVIGVALCVALTVILSIIYDVGLLAILSPDWQQQLFWMMGLTYVCWLAVGLLLLYKHETQPSQSPWFARDAMISYLIFPAIAIAAAIAFIYLEDTIDAGTFFWIFSISGACVFGAYAVYLFRVQKNTSSAEEFHKIKNAFTLYASYYGVAVGVVYFIIYHTPIGMVSGVLGEIPFLPGQATPVNYFSYIFYIFFQSPIASIMIAIMTFGMIVNIFATVLGGLGRTAIVIGVVITVVPPMIIIMEIFAGGIPPPDLLAQILGVGVASFIFALCETGVFIIMAIVLSVFSGIAEILAPKMPAVAR